MTSPLSAQPARAGRAPSWVHEFRATAQCCEHCALPSASSRVGERKAPALLSPPAARVTGKLNLTAGPADAGPVLLNLHAAARPGASRPRAWVQANGGRKSPTAALLLLVAMFGLLIASSIAWKGYVRMVDEVTTDLVGVEAGE